LNKDHAPASPSNKHLAIRRWLFAAVFLSFLGMPNRAITRTRTTTTIYSVDSKENRIAPTSNAGSSWLDPEADGYALARQSDYQYRRG
jgi:hypothetical protein